MTMLPFIIAIIYYNCIKWKLKQRKYWHTNNTKYAWISRWSYDTISFGMPKISGYVKTFKHKCGDKNKSFKLISLCIDDDKLLEKYKTIRTKTEDLKNIKLDASLVYHDRYIKTKTKTYSDKVCTNFCVLNVREDGVECEFFTVTSVDFLLLYEKNITCNYI